jgi:hypothetical protein
MNVKGSMIFVFDVLGTVALSGRSCVLHRFARTQRIQQRLFSGTAGK